MNNWEIADSVRLYRIDRWGSEFFGINEKGHLSVLPQRKKTEGEIDIMEVLREIKINKISLPAVVRFHDILRSQVIEINETFANIIHTTGFQGKYSGVFPIKLKFPRFY